ncbi:MAG: heme-binding protein [Planctomycetota bacterium]
MFSDPWKSFGEPQRRKSSGRSFTTETLERRLYAGSLTGLPFLLPASPLESLEDHPLLSSSAGAAGGTVASAPPSLRVRYDFRDQDGVRNEISPEQLQLAEQVLQCWQKVLGPGIAFVRDTASPLDSILNIGVGSLDVAQLPSRSGGVLGLGGGQLISDGGGHAVRGLVWLDHAEDWTGGSSSTGGSVDFLTVAAHETGHALGLPDSSSGLMNGQFTGPISGADLTVAIEQAVSSAVSQSGGRNAGVAEGSEGAGGAAAGSASAAQPVLRSGGGLTLSPLMDPQLKAAEVKQLLDRASAATSSDDAIIAVVDRNGRILGVRVEDGVTAPDVQTLAFMVDGAVAKARTAAMFSSGDLNLQSRGPLTSRTIRFISQSTVTQREVQSNPNSLDPALQGPGFVAPIGVGGHFPPEILHTPPVDLFAIEHTNRDSLIHAGPNGIRENGAGDDLMLSSRFDADYLPGKSLVIPESWGFASGLAPTQQSRGIATLPGGVPLFRDSDTDADLTGDTLVGGIGVFFPGSTGTADFEQGFVPGQSTLNRLNAPRVLEAEFIALAAAGGSIGAATFASPVPEAIVGPLGGVAPVSGIDLPFGNITLVGIELEIVGPTPGIQGVRDLISFSRTLSPGVVNGTDLPVTTGGDLQLDGTAVPAEWLVGPKNGAGITAADVQQIIERGIAAALKTRAAIRIPVGNRTRMTFAVTDLTGEVVGLYRMTDATVFSLDVAVAKARNTAYFARPAGVEPADQVGGVAPGTALSNRTFRFLAEPRFPAGVDGSTPNEFSILNPDRNPNLNPGTAENLGVPVIAAEMHDTVLGFDAFNPGRNFQDASTDLKKQNGIVFFPGSTPIYKAGQLVGGFGVSGDGVDQDDVVTFLGAQDFLPHQNGQVSADETFVDGVRLPFIKFNRVPFG